MSIEEALTKLELENKALREELSFALEVIKSAFENKEGRSIVMGKMLNYLKKYKL